MERDRWQCQTIRSSGSRCLRPATDCDHIVRGDDHSPSNLQAVCKWHHKAKSSREGAEAATAKRTEIDQRFRRTEAHPGLL